MVPKGSRAVRGFDAQVAANLDNKLCEQAVVLLSGSICIGNPNFVVESQ